ncbi:hypothetical protein KJ903_05540 [Patescibacteria group bacterium]|nr:hypothetical protein [Patescibacteria group bacterium]
MILAEERIMLQVIDLGNPEWLSELADLEFPKAKAALVAFVEVHAGDDALIAQLGDELFFNDIGWEIFLEAELGIELEGRLVGAFVRINRDNVVRLKEFINQLLVACGSTYETHSYWGGTALAAMLEHEDLSEADLQFVIDSRTNPDDLELSEEAEVRLEAMRE